MFEFFVQVACVNQIHKVYPNFKVPRRDTDRYGRNLTIPITAQRISEGLFLCGIRDHHLKQNPDLVSYFQCYSS